MMSGWRRALTTGVALLAAWCVQGLVIPCPAQDGKYPDPKRFEQDIRAFEAEDAGQFPAPGAILCTGSSTMRLWHATIREDLAGLTIIPRGFGGSTMNDLLYYVDRIVLPYRPRAIVIYEGDNDVAEGVSPEMILDTSRKFLKRVHERLPEARIYFLAIKPSVRRWKMWPAMKEANRLLADDCSKDRRLTFVDIASPMLDSDGNVRSDIFRDDNLHLNQKGYEILCETLKPVLLAAEQPREKANAK